MSERIKCDRCGGYTLPGEWKQPCVCPSAPVEDCTHSSAVSCDMCDFDARLPRIPSPSRAERLEDMVERMLRCKDANLCADCRARAIDLLT